MKRYFLNKWMVATLLAGACCIMAACDDDNDNGGIMPPPTDPDIEAVCGTYRGTMTVVETAPVTDEGADEPSGTALDARVTNTAIAFMDFPIRDLVIKVLGTDEGIDAIIEAIGTVEYAIPYTASMNEDKTSVVLSLDPAILVLNLPAGNDAEESAGTEIEVAISAEADGTYAWNRRNLVSGFR